MANPWEDYQDSTTTNNDASNPWDDYKDVATQEPKFDGRKSESGIPLMAGENMPDVESEIDVVDALAGVPEAGLGLATAMTSGAGGHIAGFFKGLVEELKSGNFGTAEAAKRIEEESKRLSSEYTYAPRTESGKEIMGGIAEAAQVLDPIAPLAGEIGSVARGAKMVASSKMPQPTNQNIPIVDKVNTPKITTPTEIAKIAQKASGGSKKAKAILSEEVKVNPEAVAAAERLGVELPADILGDSTLIKQTAGLVRSQIGEQSAQFADLVTSVATKADDALDQLGRTNIGSMSGKVLDSLDTSRKDLLSASEAIYKDIEIKMPKNTKVSMPNSSKLIVDIVDELGGVSQLTKEEVGLVNLLKNKNITYESLNRERRQIGESLGNIPTGKYVNADKRLLNRVFAAIKNDQLDNVEAYLGKDYRNQLHLADRTFQKKIAMDDRIAKTFGKEGEGSIASLLSRAVTQGQKGDITALNKVLKTVPKDLRKDAIISAIGEASKSGVATEAGMFDFGKFTKVYQGIRRNTPIYKEVVGAIGKDADMVLRDLYEVSRRVAEAKGNRITTGKANQEILKTFQSEAFIQKIIKATAGKTVKYTTGMDINIDGLFKSPQDKLKATGDLLKSQEFKDLAIEAIDKKPSQSLVRKLIKSPQFKAWQKKTIGMSQNPETWVYGAFTQEKEEK